MSGRSVSGAQGHPTCGTYKASVNIVHSLSVEAAAREKRLARTPSSGLGQVGTEDSAAHCTDGPTMHLSPPPPYSRFSSSPMDPRVVFATFEDLVGFVKTPMDSTVLMVWIMLLWKSSCFLFDTLEIVVNDHLTVAFWLCPDRSINICFSDINL